MLVWHSEFSIHQVVFSILFLVSEEKKIEEEIEWERRQEGRKPTCPPVLQKETQAILEELERYEGGQEWKKSRCEILLEERKLSRE